MAAENGCRRPSRNAAAGASDVSVMFDAAVGSAERGVSKGRAASSATGVRTLPCDGRKRRDGGEELGEGDAHCAAASNTVRCLLRPEIRSSCRPRTGLLLPGPPGGVLWFSLPLVEGLGSPKRDRRWRL
eukprot:8145659-Pyramimonas_sp.AAC.1